MCPSSMSDGWSESRTQVWSHYQYRSAQNATNIEKYINTKKVSLSSNFIFRNIHFVYFSLHMKTNIWNKNIKINIASHMLNNITVICSSGVCWQNTNTFFSAGYSDAGVQEYHMFIYESAQLHVPCILTAIWQTNTIRKSSIRCFGHCWYATKWMFMHFI